MLFTIELLTIIYLKQSNCAQMYNNYTIFATQL